MPIPRIEPIVIPAVPLPPPITREMPAGPVGISPPRMTEPTIDYPTIEIPNYTPEGDGQGQGTREQPLEEEEDTRDMPDGKLPPLPDPNTIIDLPPEPTPVIDVPFTEYDIPAPDAQVLSTTASAAFVATTSALAATTALKPVMDTLFKILKAVFKKVLSKVLRKKDKSWAGVAVAEVQLQSLDRFHFDSSRRYTGPQYPSKADRKRKKGGKKHQPE